MTSVKTAINLICLLIVLGTESAVAATLDLYDGWSVYQDSQLLTRRFGVLWKNLGLDQETVTVTYKKEFFFEAGEPQGLHYLIIPSSWTPYEIFFNGVHVTDNSLSHRQVARIYSNRIIPLASNLLKGKNQLTLVGRGHPLLGGFRSDRIFLTSDVSVLQKEELRNFFVNDIHIFFFIFALSLSLFFLVIHFKLPKVSLKYLYLAIASVTILPYHLLTTQFYAFFGLSDTAPFRIQLFFQLLSWAFWGLFFLSSQRQQEAHQNFFKNRYFSGVFWGYSILVGWASISFPYAWFSALIIPMFLVPAVVVTNWLIQLAQERRSLFFVAILAVLSGQISLLSEVFDLNLYLIGISHTLFGLIGSMLFVSEYLRTAEKNESSSQFLSQLLPAPIKFEVQKMIEEGLDKQEIIRRLRGDGTLSNIFVDICSFGKLTRELSSKSVYETRLLVFNFISEILLKHDIHFIKPVGDSMHFCGGIQIQRRSSQTKLSTACIYGVIDILDSVDQLNKLLEEKMLPEIKVKISATIGHCEYGFEGASDNLRFDVQGHWVNVTKRFEDAMDVGFYERFGKNVALISENLFKFSENMDLRKRFLHPYRVTDKDGKVYEALVGQQYQEAVTDQDVMHAILGQFIHHEKGGGQNVA